MNNSVGYGRPPVGRQFKPGQSGNPAGRPKRAPSFREELLEELREATAAGNGDLITKQRALIRTLVDSAIDGNLRAASVLVGFLAKAGDEAQANDVQVSDKDQNILEDYVGRELKRRGIDDTKAAPERTPKDE
jgi:hypothetical protein